MGGKKQALTQPGKRVRLLSPSPHPLSLLSLSLLRSITLSDNHARFFRAFRHPLLFPLL